MKRTSLFKLFDLLQGYIARLTPHDHNFRLELKWS